MQDAAFRLAIIQGSDVGREVTIDRELTIGRAGDMDLVLTDARVSSRHASVRPHDATGVEVIDQRSTNGTFVNEQRITAPQVIRPGDQLRLGGTIFSVIEPSPPPSSSPLAYPPTDAGAQPVELQPILSDPVSSTPVPDPAPPAPDPLEPIEAMIGLRASSSPLDAPPDPDPGVENDPDAWRLTVRTGPDAGRRIEIAEGATELIGRDIGSGLSLTDPRVSSRHAEVTNLGGILTIEDLDSANGTLVNSKRLRGHSGPLREGTEIQVGESVLITGRGPSGQSRFGPTPTIIGGVAPADDSPGRRWLAIGLAAAALVIAAAVLVVVLVSDRKSGLSTAQVAQRESPSMVEVLSHVDGKLAALGSGFTIDAQKGLILTNNHVATGGTLTVQPQAKRSIQAAATIVGALPCQDLALIRVTSGATRSVLKDSTLDRTIPSPGDSVVALGYPTSAATGASAISSETLSVTAGIVSKSHTQYDAPDSGEVLLPSVVQSTASINPGNSGGPLLNSKADVIGVDTADYEDNEDERAEGENYAISATQVLRELPLLEAGDRSQWVGLSFDGTVTNAAGTAAIALKVYSSTPGTALAADKIRYGDLLYSVDGLRTPTMQAYCRAMPKNVGTVATMVFAIPYGKSYYEQTFRAVVGKGVSDALTPGAQFGDFTIEELIGEGGMGLVYRATQSSLDRRVALKIIAPALAQDADFRERFRREARKAAAVDHPAIVPIYGAGEIDGRPYLAMRYVPGTDLGSMVSREGPLSGERALGILDQIASALDAAHADGLIHRDVKPANILIEATSSGERAYLTDFGLTRGQADTDLTRTGTFMGSPLYMSPEQIQGGDLDARADQYSLACVTYEALTGQTPFLTEGQLQAIYAHLHTPPPKLTDTLSELPDAVDAVLARALSKSATDRYDSCREFLSEFRTAAGLPVSTRVFGARSSGGRPTPTVVESVGVGQLTLPGRSGAANPSASRRRPMMMASAGLVVIAAIVVAVVLISTGSGAAKHASKQPSTGTSTTGTGASAAAGFPPKTAAGVLALSRKLSPSDSVLQVVDGAMSGTMGLTFNTSDSLIKVEYTNLEGQSQEWLLQNESTVLWWCSKHAGTWLCDRGTNLSTATTDFIGNYDNNVLSFPATAVRYGFQGAGRTRTYTHTFAGDRAACFRGTDSKHTPRGLCVDRHGLIVDVYLTEKNGTYVRQTATKVSTTLPKDAFVMPGKYAR